MAEHPIQNLMNVTIEKILVGCVLAVEIGDGRGKAEAHLGHRQDGGAVIGGQGWLCSHNPAL